MSDMFHVAIRNQGKDLFLVTASWAGETSSESVNFTSGEEYKLAKKQLLQRTPGLSLVSLDAQAPVCAQIGRTLFDTFMSASVLALFRQYRESNDPPRVGLHLSRELYREPWELLKDPEDEQQGDYLSLIGSVVRFDADSGEPDPRTRLIPPARSLRCLFVSPQATATPGEQSVPYIRPENFQNVVFDIVNPPTYVDFMRAADNDKTNPDGFIFYGHGKVKDGIGHLIFVELQGLIMKKAVDDVRRGSAISTALATKRNLRFSFLMACETAWINDDDDQDMKFEDTVAGTLMSQTRIGFVLGAQLKIDFGSAHTFLITTLQQVQAGVPLDLAMKIGRRNIRGLLPDSNARSPLDWWVPVLYAKSTMFDILAPESVHQPNLNMPL
jgi:hypothetical protein